MSRTILDLPSEISDYIFGYLPLEDQKNARLICRQWNQQLSSPRYYKNTKLRLATGKKHLVNDDLLRAAGQRKIHCIELTELTSTASEEEKLDIVQLLEACRFSLETLSLFHCSELTMRAIPLALGKMPRLGNLRIRVGNLNPFLVRGPKATSKHCTGQSGNKTKVPSIISESVGFALITHLEVNLINESCVELVCSFASQLLCLVLNADCGTVLKRVSLVRPPNTYHELRSDTGHHAGRTWRRVLADTYKGLYVYNVLDKMLLHCQHLKCLAIECDMRSIQCIQQIGTLKGLKDLQLNDGLGFGYGDPLPILDLPNLESLALSTGAKIRLSEQMPRLTSVVIKGCNMSSSPKAILSEIIKLDRIGGRRLRRLHFDHVTLDREANAWLGCLSIDVLSFEHCRIDPSLLDVLAESETRKKIRKIVMHNNTLMLRSKEPSGIRTVEELCDSCPYLQIAHSKLNYDY